MSLAQCLPGFTISKYESYFGIFHHLTFSPLMYYTCFCEFVIFQPQTSSVYKNLQEIFVLFRILFPFKAIE